MNDKTWEKYGALGVIWFLVFGLVGALAGGTPPSRSDPAADIAKHYLDNDSAIQFGTFLTGLAVIGLVWWFGSLWRAMVRAEDGSPRLAIIALVGFVISGMMALTGFAVNAATAAGIEQITDGSAAFFLGLSTIFLSLSPIGDVIMVGAVTGLAWRTGFLPKWLAQAGVLVVLVSLVASGGVASDADFFGVFGLVAFIIWSLWLLSVGVTLYRNAPEDV